LVESTTHGLNIAANAIPLERGDKVVLADTDFLQVAIPWCKKRDSIGIEIIIVQSGDRGVLTTGDFDRMLDASTKVVCVSSVQWSTGYRLNMQELGELCRSRGIWLVVDAVQELGA
ncbi:MAG: aminotransferase class V-fold PLP-dependent enzyme, partial [Anaerolineae bacterium]|nr:aminotransferase class V-fold PLP-dependent enzyme [Anaerolineae bacterium]